MTEWPYAETVNRKPDRFQNGLDDTLRIIRQELEHLEATGVAAIRVVTRDIDSVRRDGMLRANAQVLHPGVALSFTGRQGSITIPCDTFESRWHRGSPSWQVNLRAIALGLRLLRRIDDYGIAPHGEQYAGWKAIEATSPVAAEAERWLRELVDSVGLAQAPLPQVIRVAKRITHPDSGGDQGRWEKVERARKVLGF